MPAAFDALQNFEAAVVAHGDLVHALELLGDAEPLAHHLQGGAGAARGRFPAAEEQQAGAVEAGDAFDGRGQRGSGFEGIGEAGGRTVQRHQFERHLLRHGHHHLLQLGFGPRLTSHTLLPGVFCARWAASNSAWPAHGSSTAGSIISFFREGRPDR